MTHSNVNVNLFLVFFEGLDHTNTISESVCSAALNLPPGSQRTVRKEKEMCSLKGREIFAHISD